MLYLISRELQLMNVLVKYFNESRYLIIKYVRKVVKY